jgi:glycosyltransferase involved in cell wall biosynthesis
LTLVGGQPRPDDLHTAGSRGLAVQFLPNIDPSGVVGILRSGSIFVMPGISEGMSNALLEAMAVGLAPVVADTPANRALITHNLNGLTYDPDSAPALADALITLLRNAEQRRMLGNAARVTVTQHYRLDDIAAQYSSLYNRMLGESP